MQVGSLSAVFIMCLETEGKAGQGKASIFNKVQQKVDHNQLFCMEASREVRKAESTQSARLLSLWCMLKAWDKLSNANRSLSATQAR